MKISKLFHTLYAFLMFLPVIVLPLFAININQKEVEPLTAQIEETKVVDFNQLISFNLRYDTVNGLSVLVEDNKVTFLNGTASVTDSSTVEVLIPYITTYNHIYIEKFNIIGNLPPLRFGNFGNNRGNEFNSSGTIRVSLNDSNDSRIICSTIQNNTYDGSFTFNLIDLTLMFGSGNEPTLEQFNLWYPNDYYDYTLGRKELLHTGVSDTLNNTDVGSQFLYSLYNPLKDYFNLPNYMNLGGLYDWFLVNLFSGYNSPVYFIIFDLMIYWLAMSLLWLIFDVLMYVPSMIHKMLDKARME